jgi:hypothetical protein
MGYALLTPVSTLKTFYWWTDGARTYFLCAVVTTGLFGIGLLAGLIAARHQRRVSYVSALLATFAGFFPMALVHHVSEHYLAASSFFFSLLFMTALDGLLEAGSHLPTNTRVRSVVVVGLIGYLALHVHGFVSKEMVALEAGRRDLADADEIVEKLKAFPHGRTVAILYDPGGPRNYSCYNSRTGAWTALAQSARAGKIWRAGDEASDVTIRLQANGKFVVGARAKAGADNR